MGGWISVEAAVAFSYQLPPPANDDDEWAESEVEGSPRHPFRIAKSNINPPSPQNDDQCPESDVEEAPKFGFKRTAKPTFKAPPKLDAGKHSSSIEPSCEVLHNGSTFNNSSEDETPSSNIQAPTTVLALTHLMTPSLTPPAAAVVSGLRGKPGIPSPVIEREGLRELPFRFLALPRIVQERILRKTLPCGKLIQPWYNEGSIQVPFGAATHENLDVSLFLINKEVSQMALAILYGKNDFNFRNPDFARWFCKRIGWNLIKIKYMTMHLTTGFPPGLDASLQWDRDLRHSLTRNLTFDVTFEQRWSQFIAWLRTRHEVIDLWVFFGEFERWDGKDSWGRTFSLKYTREDFEEVTRERITLIHMLSRLKIDGEVNIFRGVAFTQRESQELANIMKFGNVRRKKW